MLSNKNLWYQLSTASTGSEGKALLGFGLEVHLEAVITWGRTTVKVNLLFEQVKSLFISPRLVSVI